MKTRFKSEAEVGEIVKEYLEGGEVYCEVDVPFGRIDLVAVNGPVITAIETKRNLSLNVLGQAISRTRYAHRSIAAFPMPRDVGPKIEVLDAVCKQTGIGIWIVSDRMPFVEELYAPRLIRRPSNTVMDIRCSLHPNQRDQPTGVNRGHWTLFGQTRRHLNQFVADHPGCTLKEAIDGIDHHYKTPKSARFSIAKWIRKGVIPQVNQDVNGQLWSTEPEQKTKEVKSV